LGGRRHDHRLELRQQKLLPHLRRYWDPFGEGHRGTLWYDRTTDSNREKADVAVANLEDADFWSMLSESRSVCQPLIKNLRLNDTIKPNMAEIYYGWKCMSDRVAELPSHQLRRYVLRRILNVFAAFCVRSYSRILCELVLLRCVRIYERTRPPYKIREF